MVRKRLTLADLKKAVARAKKKASTAQERAQLESELKQLQAGTSTKLLKRLGRGFVILTKKGARATGKGIVKARKFAEETGAGEGLDIELASSIPRRQRPVRQQSPRKVRRVRTVRRSPSRVVVTKRTKITTRGVRRKPRRRVARRAPQDNSGFFGGLDFGI